MDDLIELQKRYVGEETTKDNQDRVNNSGTANFQTFSTCGHYLASDTRLIKSSRAQQGEVTSTKWVTTDGFVFENSHLSDLCDLGPVQVDVEGVSDRGEHVQLAKKNTKLDTLLGVITSTGFYLN